MPKYEVWYQSHTTHRAVIDAENLVAAVGLGVDAVHDPYVEFDALDTDWVFISVNLEGINAN